MTAPDGYTAATTPPEETAAALRDGWLHTGDVGRVNPDGYRSFVDRRKDVIKPGGENVSASEIEMVLGEFPGAAAVGRPDPAALYEQYRARLARFKVAEENRVVETLLRTSIGKVEKKTLRILLEAESRL